MSRSITLGTVVLLSAAANGQEPNPRILSPGQTLAFETPDGDGIDCGIGFGLFIEREEERCSRTVRFLGTGSPSAGVRLPPLFVDVPDDRRLVTTYRGEIFELPGFPALGAPDFATAWVFNDFTIAGQTENVVDAQVSVTFDYVHDVFGIGAYETRGLITIHIFDITDGPAQPLPVTTHTAVEVTRSGSQGFTDVAGARLRDTYLDENTSFIVKLRRGRTYRLVFQSQTMGHAFLVGELSIIGHAGWKHLSVTIDEDTTEQLETLDARMDRLETMLNQLLGGTASSKRAPK